MTAFVIIAAALLLLVSRFIYLQVVAHEEFATRSASNQVRVVPVPPNRGLIYDRRGRPIAENRPAYRLEIVPEKIGDLDAVIGELGRIIELPEDALERPAKQVAEDFRLGYISGRTVRDIYGVVVEPVTGDLDEAETLALREVLLRSRIRLATVTEDSSYRQGNVSQHRVCHLHPSVAEKLDANAGRLIELDSGRGAPLRAWLVIDDAVEASSCPIDTHGQSMLGLGVGDPVEIRLLA